MKPADKHYKVIPSDESCCIWMSAGLLSFQLCDRNFECESCPLDHALRAHVRRSGGNKDGHAARPLGEAEEVQLLDDCRYSRNHCWVKQETKSLLRVGIEPALSAALLAPRAVVFPSSGQILARRQACLWIVLEGGGTFPLASPLDGTLRRTNALLAAAPHLLHFQPFEDGWMYEVETNAAALEAANLMDGQQASAKFSADRDSFLASLQNSQRKSSSTVGITLADGGQRLQNMADILGQSRYFDMVRKAFC
jgi:glycine cleavage system H lipoate-binding protein